MTRGRAAAYIPFGTAVDVSVQRARTAERSGYEAIFVNQLPDVEDAPTLLAAHAAATCRIGLGTGVLPIYARHPTAMAQMAIALDNLSGGRFLLGIGVGHELTVEWNWGLRFHHPVRAMREYLTIVRSSIRDGKAELKGEHFTARWAYTGQRRPDLPIYVAALGPRMLQLAGELADGVILCHCSPTFVRAHVIPHLRLGRQRAGLGLEGFEIVQTVPLSLTSDAQAGRDRFRRTLRFYARLPFYRRVLDASGFAEELAAGDVTDGMICELAGIGGEREMREIGERFREAGCTLLAAWPLAEHRGAAGIEATIEAAFGCLTSS
jgi:F420-dependent oxidoreductase-like protein